MVILLTIISTMSVAYAGSGVFRMGNWYIDANGNGIWDPTVDQSFQFGMAGDLPIWVPVHRKISCPQPSGTLTICDAVPTDQNCFANIGVYIEDDFGYIQFCNGNDRVKIKCAKIRGE